MFIHSHLVLHIFQILPLDSRLDGWEHYLAARIFRVENPAEGRLVILRPIGLFK